MFSRYALRSFSAAVILGGAIAATASATTLLNEPFNYIDGQLTNLGSNVSGGLWTTTSGTGTPLQVVSGAITGLTHGSGSREDASRPFSASDINFGFLYASFELTVTAAPTTSLDYFFALHPLSNSNFRDRVFISAPATAGSAFRIGLENDGATTTILTNDLPIGTYDLLVRVSLTDNTSSLWIGSDIGTFVESSPTLTDTVAPTLAALGRVILRQGGNGLGTNTVNIDNIVVADTFVEAVPEPSTLLGLIGGTALLGMIRRRSR